MNYFTLPHFYYCNKINQYFSQLLRDEKYVKPDVKFTSTTGSFPYCYWNGGMNSFEGPLELRDNIMSLANSNILPIRLNCANLYLTEHDYKDSRLNKILEVCHCGSNFVEVSDLNLYEYLKDRYPNYKYIFSSNANELNEYNQDILNAIIEQDVFDLVQVPLQFNNIEFLKGINNRSKLEVTMLRPNHCPDYQSCLTMEQMHQYNFSEKSCYKNCNKCTSYRNDIYMTWNDIRTYNKLGINNFRVADCGLDEASKNSYILYLIDMFVKEDKQSEFTSKVLRDKGTGII